MSKKNVPIQVPMQMDFGFEVMDAQGNTPPFLHKQDEVIEALAQIKLAQWVSVDVETTGLTEASMPVQLGVQEVRQGASNEVRLRTIQARIPTENGRKGPRVNFAFDADRMGPALTKKVAETILSRRMFIAHNAGFDLYWLRRAQGRTVMPEMVLDTMLLVRLLNPKLVLRRAELIESIRSPQELTRADPIQQAAWKSLISGASGGSLADVVLAMFEHELDKTYQKPDNWTGLLGFEHYNYAIDDVVWADRILCKLLGLELDEGDILRGYLGVRARSATVRLIEPQVPDLVRLRETGMPMNLQVAQRYVDSKNKELAKWVDEMIAIEPLLEAHRAILSDPDAGLSDDLKRALANAFETRGVTLRRTTATGTPQVGEKDLRACRAAKIEDAKPLFNAWVAVCKAKKLRQMALETIGFALRSDDGRLHSLMSHGPVTGRLSASEPNCFRGDTEILTPNGWVRFDALSADTPVAQYREGEIEFVQPMGHIRSTFSGSLTQIQAGHFTLLSTPNHRHLLKDADGVEHVCEAHEYSEGMRQLHAARYGGGSGLQLTDRDLFFVVLAALYGRFSPFGEFQMVFWNKAKAAKFARMFGDNAYVKRRGIKSTFYFYHGNLQVERALSLLGESLEFGPWLWRLSRDQLDTVLNAVEQFGMVREDLGRGLTYKEACKRASTNASWIQALLVASGKGAYLRKGSEVEGWSVYYTPDSAQTETTGRVMSEVPYEGQVYCVTVPSGFIVVRQNGVPFVTGNCQQWPRDQLFRAMCMSEIEAGKEVTTVRVTEHNRSLLAKCMDDVDPESLEVGQEVQLDTAWLTAQFYSNGLGEGWPKEEQKAFIDFIWSHFKDIIVASDFGALDVRVGAALCVRAQREMLDLANGKAVPGPVQPPQEVVDVIKQVAPLLNGKDAVQALASKEKLFAHKAERIQQEMDKLREDFDADRIERRRYFRLRGELKDQLLAQKLGWRLAQCLGLAAGRGMRDYSALRDAFVADIDIHTFTGMKLIGRDPMKEFEGLSVPERKALESKIKREIGPRRQQGKIANLSLLYGMADAGFQEAAARGYNEHWTLEESADIRNLWLNAYPEVELWHLWTECLQAGTVYLPERGRDRLVRTGWWVSRTLSGREIVAFGLNSALSYQDQSSGADILGLIMHRLQSEYPHVFAASINQVHDEQVFCVPRQHFDEYLKIIETVMVEEANSQTMPYGVPCAVSPASGPLWVKD